MTRTVLPWQSRNSLLQMINTTAITNSLLRKINANESAPAVSIGRSDDEATMKRERGLG